MIIIQICERNNINIPENGGKIKRNDNYSRANIKETYMNSYDKIIEIFKFKKDLNHLEPVLELFKVIILDNKKTNINFEILKIHKNMINLDALKLELQTYIAYKELNNQISWTDFDILVKEFDQKDLKNPLSK